MACEFVSATIPWLEPVSAFASNSQWSSPEKLIESQLKTKRCKDGFFMILFVLSKWSYS